MNIKLCYQRDNRRIQGYIEKLKELNINPILDDEIINFGGRTINVIIYDQLRSRDPKNPQVIEFKKRLMQIQMEKIKTSDALLVLNEYEITNLPSNFLYEIFTANVLEKPIFLLNPLPYESFANDEINAIGAIFLKGDNFDIILESIKKKTLIKAVEIVKDIFTGKGIGGSKKFKLKKS